MTKDISAPLVEEEVSELKAGDYVYITGTIYSARDAAHQRMYDGRLVQQDLRRAAGWINMPRY